MTANSPEVIYLIDTGDGVAWCDDPDPTGDGERDDAVKYVRGDAYEALQAECEKLRKGMEAVAELMDQSSGVAGLHLNGDVAPWHELRQGGSLENWLVDFDDAMAGGDHGRLS